MEGEGRCEEELCVREEGVDAGPGASVVRGVLRVWLEEGPAMHGSVVQVFEQRW